MSSNFESFHEILKQANSENFSCLFHVEPRNLPRCPKPGARWSGPWESYEIVGSFFSLNSKNSCDMLKLAILKNWILMSLQKRTREHAYLFKYVYDVMTSWFFCLFWTPYAPNLLEEFKLLKSFFKAFSNPPTYPKIWRHNHVP